MTLDSREIATVLAALRFWQDQIALDNPLDLSPDHFLGDEPLTDKEIDDLCEYLNSC